MNQASNGGMAPMTVGVAVITHCSKRHLPHSLPPLLNSSLHPRVLVVNSSSNDGTVELAREMGAEVLIVPRKEFNHGATREIVRHTLGTDIVVMMTPDAYAVSDDMLETLTRPIREGKASIAYARQIPHDGADFFESFPRFYNYPTGDHIRGLEDVDKYGSFVTFCSDSCTAWSNHALDEVGGFLTTLTSEDALTAAMLLQKGHKIAYVGSAVVKHSHRYTLSQEFHRYFDTGYVRGQFSHLTLGLRDEQHGKKFFGSMITALLAERPALVPYAVVQTAVKYLGYKLGMQGPKLPWSVCRRLSAQDFYWVSVHCPKSAT